MYTGCFDHLNDHWKNNPKEDGVKKIEDRTNDAEWEFLRITNDLQAKYFTKYFKKKVLKLIQKMQPWIDMADWMQRMIQEKILEVFLQEHGPCEWARLIFEKSRKKWTPPTLSRFTRKMNREMRKYKTTTLH